MKNNKQARRQAKQLYRDSLVNGLLDESRALQAARLTVSAGRRNGPVTLAHFLRLVRLDCARHSARIESATTLSPDLQAGIEANLKTRYGKGLTTTFGECPALIGGV